jgi:hypothetical protein
MTLTPTVPSTIAGLVSALSNMIADVNSLWEQVAANSWTVGSRDLALVAPATSFAGVSIPIEIIFLTADAPVSLEQITNGAEGAIKILVADDDNITLVHDAAGFVLRGGLDLALAAGNIIALLNRDGEVGVSDGYWRELFRTIF